MRPLCSQLTFADVEMQRMLALDPVLQAVTDLLDQHAELVQLVHSDLQRGLKNPQLGRTGISPSQVLRSLVLMRIKNWDYRELRERIHDGITLRTFTAFDSNPVPKHDAFNRAFNRITPETMEAINLGVIQAAVDLGLEDGKNLRVATVVETNVHYPTDATLLWDCVRTLHRLMKQMKKQADGLPRFPGRTRCARRRMQQIQRMTAQQRATQQKPKYRELIEVTEEVAGNAGSTVKAARKMLARKKAPLPVEVAAALGELCQQIEHYVELTGQVIGQSRRRVLEGEEVPTEEKLFSIFEPHTDLIKRGKAQKPVEFGHKVFLAESGKGLITGYRVLEGNPADSTQVQASLDQHEKIFKSAPQCYASDRGFHSAGNIVACQEAGVVDICIPQRGGGKSDEQAALEKTATFRQGQRFRAGIEGRISVLFRGRGMKRCLWKGQVRFEVLVGACVLANNLLRIAQLLSDDKASKKPSRKAAPNKRAA
ncbi:MAG: ISNCY family transposase [Bryobacteraceae bacterium]